jgi:arginyl-tRNA synthetase
VQGAAEHLNPAALCAAVLALAQAFHRFVHDHHVLTATTGGLRDARLCLCIATGVALRSGLQLLGIDAPERM